MSLKIPLFPLPGVVLLPGTLLPLHVFEPRYREMVAHALAGEGIIGMALLADGSDPMAAAPPIHPVGGAGRIVEVEALEDGRYNIVLEGRFRYRVVSEDPPAPYRVATVEPLPPVPFSRPEEEERTCRLARELFETLRGALDLPPLEPAAPEAEPLASQLAIRLRYEPAELQAILETDSIRARLAAVIGRMRRWKQTVDVLAPFRANDLDPTRN
jgi:Lon protease-like protein